MILIRPSEAKTLSLPKLWATPSGDGDQEAVKAPVETGRPATVREYFGTSGVVHAGPQCILVDRPLAGDRIEPHFHDTDQFQVIVAGDGRLGAQGVRPIAFHYADAFTPYGPIVANREGIAFFSMRPIAVGGVFFIPAARGLLPGKPGRNLVGMFDIDRPLPAKGQSVREVLLSPQPDGVEALGIRLGSNAFADGLASQAGGQYCLVCSGSLLHENKEAPAWSVAFIEPGEMPPAFQAGPAGAQLLIMQFATPSQRPGSDPLQLAGRAPDSYQYIA